MTPRNDELGGCKGIAGWALFCVLFWILSLTWVLKGCLHG